jgi:hypothetical protein
MRARFQRVNGPQQKKSFPRITQISLMQKAAIKHDIGGYRKSVPRSDEPGRTEVGAGCVEGDLSLP